MKKWLLPLSCLALAATLGACNMPYNAGTRTKATDYGARVAHPWNANAYNPAALNRTTAPYGTAPTATATFNRDMAHRLARVADGVPGVQAATAVVRGSDAVIGIDTGMAASDTNRRHYLEQRVLSATRSVAPGYNIRVTSDPNLLSRIRSMDQSLRMYNYGAPAGTTGAPTTVVGGLTNVGNDFVALLRDVGRTVIAPFR